MNKEESDLIIAEQNKSTEEILKAAAKMKSDYHELCKLKDMRIAELEAQLKTVSLKIISCIKIHLCRQDEDYDKEIISPKFLSDILDQMAADGFEEINEK